MKYMHKAFPILVPYLLLALFLMLTDPFKLPIVLLLIPYVLLAVGLYNSGRFFGRLVQLPAAKQKLTAGIMTSLIMLVVLLQSIRQLSVRDFLILAVLLVGVTWYIRRLDV